MATTKLTTIDDLWQIEEPGRYDLIRGELYEMPPAGAEHGEIGMSIGAQLWQHVTRHQLGKVFNGDTGFIISQDEQTWLSPDVAFVRAERLPQERWTGFVPVPPDLAVEIVSPSDRPSLVASKVLQYLGAGVALVWVVEPEDRTITVFAQDGSRNVYRQDDEIDGGDVVPGFSVRVDALLAHRHICVTDVARMTQLQV
jgi:Uma2 family endonuclease